MKSFITSAVLSAAALVNAASLPHGHAHLHTKSVAAPVEKREASSSLLSAADTAMLADILDSTWNAASSIMVGTNLLANESDAAVTIGGDGPFLVHFHNDSDEDMVLVVWSNVGKANSWDTANVKTYAPDVTQTLVANASTTVSFNPAVVSAQSISGGWAAVFSNTTMNNGYIKNTWGEYTFVTTSTFSTTDVSRLPYMKGDGMAIHNFNTKGDDTPACSSTMTVCSYVCSDASEEYCTYGGKLQSCAVGTSGTTASADGADGGCGGLREDGGYIRVNFY